MKSARHVISRLIYAAIFLAAFVMLMSATGRTVQAADNFLDVVSPDNTYVQLWAHRDNNLNRIDDVIDHILENRDLFEERRTSFVLSGQRDDMRGSFIVNFSRAVENEDIERLSQIVGRSNVHRFARVNAVSIRGVVPRLAENLAKLSGVQVVELQQRVRSFLDVSARAVKARPSTDYSNVWEELGVDGTGVNIAIIDTGVDDEHESLSGKYVAGVDTTGPTDLEFNPNDQSDYDTFHGTHIAGAAMGTGGSAQTYRGVAPGAGLIDVRVLDEKGEGTSESLIRGIEWCIANKDKYDIGVISLSLGTDSNSNGSDAQSQAVNEAAEAGIVVVVAAGNDGEEGYISSPGAADNAITVGALFDHSTVNRTDDTLASYSNQGPRLDDGDSDSYDELKPDVTAPGTYIMSAKGSNATASNGYHQLSGTSMATPHVAGVVALMLDANPNLTPSDVKQILRDTAETRGLPYDPELSDKYNIGFGWGMIDAYAAVQSAMGAAGNPDFSISQSDISFSDNTPVENQRILITATVHNGGDLDGTCDVAFYRQDGLLTRIGRVRGIHVMAGGTADAKLARASTTQGDYVVKVVVENASPSENNTTNNEATASITVDPPPTSPDLTLMEHDIYFGKATIQLGGIGGVLSRDVSFQDIQSPLSGQPLTVRISARIHNVGKTDATCDVKFYIDQKIPENLIKSFDQVFVSAQDENLLSTTWDLPEDLEGDHAIWVVIENVSPDDDDLLNNEASRGKSLPTKMTTGDIAVANDDIALSDNEPSGGEKINVNVTVYNAGVIDVENVKVALYIDNVPTATGAISFIQQNSENSVGIEWVAEEGNHEIGVYVSLEGVQESNYANNTATTYISVKPAGISWEMLWVVPFVAIGAAALLIWKYRRRKT